jgi:hypothetical protein
MHTRITFCCTIASTQQQIVSEPQKTQSHNACQYSVPLLRGGNNTIRERVLMPGPHDAEHAEYRPHSASSQSTEHGQGSLSSNDGHLITNRNSIN